MTTFISILIAVLLFVAIFHYCFKIYIMHKDSLTLKYNLDIARDRFLSQLDKAEDEFNQYDSKGGIS